MDTVSVNSKNEVAANHLNEILSKMEISGTLFIGHPTIENANDRIDFDAVLVSIEYGVIGFDFNDDTAPTAYDLEEKQTKLHHSLKSLLYSNRLLLERRELAIPVSILTLTERQYGDAYFEDINFCSPDLLSEKMDSFSSMDEKFLAPALATLQNTTTLKPPRRRLEAKTEGSRGSILKEIEKAITKFDQWQNRAALETPGSPQRIRGLAGSGKTVILANKAARLHYLHPEWKIAITFNTRTLYQQFKDLVRRFYYQQANEEPNWDNIQIRHAWGGTKRPGIYYQTAERQGVSIRNFGYAEQMFGSNLAFDGVCKELLSEVSDEHFSKIYDVILIDEAQDLPKSFFELVYHITKDPKRIVWAYDELQNLVDYTMLPPEELFGTHLDGSPKVEIGSNISQLTQDMILPVCYRNTPWALTIAHGLGFGTGRIGGLVQFFEDPSLWDSIGYEVVSGSLDLGQNVTLRRKSDAYPAIFKDNLLPIDVVKTMVFNDDIEQANWVANEIISNIKGDELQTEDIMVIIADPRKLSSLGGKLKAALKLLGLNSHSPGVGESQDEFFINDSIVVTTIHRAKGNEAAMVYLLASEYGNDKFDLIKRRNTLFTGITRSRAWVRVCGTGNEMSSIKQEIDIIVGDNHELKFKVPSANELEKMRKIHRDRSIKEIKRLENIIKTTEEFAEKLDSGDLSIESLSQNVRNKLQDALNRVDRKDS
ncbi:DEAD/DEAH box helicase [Deinococcus sp. Leaf326]|uniref:DEAD/DEAH box helicase n=1 Tax=Deinococcus sp. Leaf326 TaxID=1736338 RepID=UPI0009EC4FD2|nr:ATP-binding domain-containing protein [Deinococcus sp. Leaf326]